MTVKDVLAVISGVDPKAKVYLPDGSPLGSIGVADDDSLIFAPHTETEGSNGTNTGATQHAPSGVDG